LLKYHENKYWWKGTLQQAKIVRALGFIRDEKLRLWYTTRALTAYKLIQHAVNDETKAQIAKDIIRIESNIEASWAVGSNKIHHPPKGYEYLPFQHAGIDFIVNRPNTILADDMGLGKTIQAIGALNHWSNINNVLIVCPASVKYQWRNEIMKWSKKYYNILVASGRGDQRVSSGGPEIIIMNYDIASAYRSFIATTKWDLKIVDEFHYIMNPKAQRTLTVLSAKADKNIFLSGSPAEKPIELWPSLRHLDPDTYNNFWTYAHRYCDLKVKDVGTKRHGTWDFSGATNLEELNTDLRSKLMIRRLKSQVAPQLGEKRKMVVPLSFPFKLSTHIAYEDSFILRKTGKQVRAHTRPSPYEYDKAIAILTTERTTLDDNMAKVRRDLGVIKIPMVIDFINNALLSKNKIICYAYHREVIDRYAKYYGNKCVVIKGGVHAHTRAEVIKRFKDDPECKVFIGQIKAVGTGTDGLQDITDTAVFAEIDWSFKNMAQAEDRVHRLGQKGSALYYYLVIDGSLESYMAKKLQMKKHNHNAMFDHKYSKKRGGDIFDGEINN